MAAVRNTFFKTAFDLRHLSCAQPGDTSQNDGILVDIGPQTSPWFPAGLVLDLEGLLGQPVDVVTERALRPELRDAVLRDARPL